MNPQLFVLKAAPVNNGEGLFFFFLFVCYFSVKVGAVAGEVAQERKKMKSIMSRLEAGLTQRFSCLISSGRQSN